VDFVVNPSSRLRGEPKVPGDKSISHRALMLSALGDGPSTISDFLNGEDCLATLNALRTMGIRIDQIDEWNVRVVGNGMHGLRAPGKSLDMGNSGTAMRLFSGLLAAQPFSSELTGDVSLSGRPMNRVIAPLQLMGAEISAKDGRPPLAIRGSTELQGIEYQLPVASAQVKSAILLAGLYAAGETRVIEPATTRDHTERMLQSMGVDLHSSNGVIALSGGQLLKAVDIRVPADLSSAAFAILAGLITDDSDILLRNVGVNPSRTGVIDILVQMGARITLQAERQSGNEPVADIRVRSSDLHGIDVDPGLVSLAIDEFPVLFVAAAFARGTTRFSGIGELRVKESDRIGSMATGLADLGIKIKETEDGAEIEGGTPGGGVVKSFGDHRIAMSFAIAGAAASAPVTVLDTANVHTSFPGFVDFGRQLGIDIKECEAE
jgi:3-phosphoshikimate 1-carboxyvinyltransferase